MEIEFRIVYHPLVLKDDLPKISSPLRLRIRKAIEQKLMVNPLLFGVPLRQSLKGYRKFRVGDYRVVFFLEKKTVFVLAILHRSIVYQLANRRSN